MKPELISSSRRALGLAALAAAASLVGCIVVPRPYSNGGSYPYPQGAPQGGTQPQGYYEANVPPPPQRDEVYGVAPVVGWIWLSGYWGWNLGRHVWIGGQWAAPRQGHYWVPHRWERNGNGWRMNDGHWARR